MTIIKGNNAYVNINSKDLSAYVTGVDLDLKGKSLIEVTAMGAAGRAWASDELNDVSFTVDFLFDDTATTGPWAVLEALWDADAAFAFVLGIDGNAAPKLEGTCWMEGLPIPVKIGDMVRIMGVVFRVEGAPTVTPA